MGKIILIIIILLFIVIGIGTILFMIGVSKSKPEWLQKLEDEEQREYLKRYENKGE